MSKKTKKPKKISPSQPLKKPKLQIYVYGNPTDCKNVVEYIKVDNSNSMQYEVIACCYFDRWLSGSLLLGVQYISIEDLLKRTKNNKHYLLIISDDKYIQDVNDIFDNHNSKNVIPVSYLISHKKTMRTSLNSLQAFHESNSSLFIASPPKTGNVTLAETFDNNNLDFFGLMHDPYKFKSFSTTKKMKVITAVREPITQKLSLIYYYLSTVNDSIYSKELRKLFENKEQFAKNLDNIYPIFELYTNKKVKDILDTDKYMESFNQNIINLYKHDFDKEKGYSIIKQGNVEVFVYQLEKMNDIASEMSDWIGQKPFDTWVKGNESSSKWIADHYKLAQKEIKFSQEFFDDCYNQKWVEHFYSQEDISKFKERWSSHIKD